MCGAVLLGADRRGAVARRGSVGRHTRSTRLDVLGGERRWSARRTARRLFRRSIRTQGGHRCAGCARCCLAGRPAVRNDGVGVHRHAHFALARTQSVESWSDGARRRHCAAQSTCGGAVVVASGQRCDVHRRSARSRRTRCGAVVRSRTRHHVALVRGRLDLFYDARDGCASKK